LGFLPLARRASYTSNAALLAMLLLRCLMTRATIARQMSLAQESSSTSCKLSQLFTFYYRLSGKFAFPGTNYKEILAKNKECEVSYSGELWKSISLLGKDLLEKMLAK
jgi:hypothetical protein